MLRSKFLWKLYAGYVVLIVLTAAIIGVLESNHVVRDALEKTEERLHDNAILLREITLPYLRDRGDAAPLQEQLVSLGNATGTRFTVVAADGTVIADSDEDPALMENHGRRPEINDARDTGASGASQRFSTTLRKSMLYVAIPVRHDGRTLGFARTAHPQTGLIAQTRQLRVNIALAALIASGLASVVGLLFVRGLTRRLRAMTRVAEAMASGDHGRRAPPMGDDEMGKLARALNAMAGELAKRVDTMGKERAEVLAILKSMVEGVIAVDRTQRVVLINEEARKMLRIGDADVAGRPVWEITRVPAVPDILDLAIRNAHPEHDEVVLPMLGGDRFLGLHSTPLRNDQDEVAGAVVVLHDITELRRLEEVRRDFVTNVSHELKTPLTAIRGFVETLLDDDRADAATHQRFLGKIRDHSHRLSSLVSDLLTLSRVESQGVRPEQTPIDLREPVRASAALLQQRAEDKGLAMTVDLGDEPVRVAGDGEMLRQVVDNLVDNAVKYTPSGGRIQVRLEQRKASAILEVQDTGVGLEPQNRQRIFERFYRVDRARSRELGGTGLGLSIVKHVVLAHDGVVSVDSTPGGGSTFRVELPVAHDAAATTPSGPPAASPDERDPRRASPEQPGGVHEQM